VNRQIHLQGGPNTIIGVMPADFQFQQQGIDYWAPLAVASQPDPGARLFSVRARLRADVPLARAQAELSTLAFNLAGERPANKGWGWQVRPLNEALFGWAREPLIVFELAVGLVLLIAVANVAALLLSRATVRAREMALRTALGAARGRLIRQLLAESMLLAIGGGVVGLLVAFVGQRALVEMQGPPAAPALTVIGLNFRVLGLLALLSISAGLACGLVPAIRSSRRNPIGALQQSGPGIGAARQPVFARGMLVALQLALALILLIGSGLLLNSLLRLVQRDLNFDPQGLVRLDYSVPPAQWAQRIGKHNGFPYFEFKTPPSQKLQQVLEQLRTVSGAESVAGISAPPVDSFVLASPDVRIDSSGGAKTGAAYFIVTPSLFQTIGTSMVSGRDFTDRDTAITPWVTVVNETCARLFWPDGHPIGKHLTLDTVPEEQPREVVGVVRDIPTRHAEPPQPVIYASYLQQPTRYRAPWVNLLGQMTFMIRTSGDTQAVIPAARHAVAQLDPDRSLVNVSSVLSHMRNATGRFRDYVFLVSILAFVATLLAAIGTYGVMSYAVSQHTREIGIRRALGAGRREVVRFVGRSALIVVGIGLVTGLTGALLLTRLIASQLWGVTPTDPLTYGGVSIILIGVAAVACIVPARRALAVDPTVALRTD
jgi:putative ABC transport system permease protein